MAREGDGSREAGENEEYLMDWPLIFAGGQTKTSNPGAFMPTFDFCCPLR